jgi:gluconolactonase
MALVDLAEVGVFAEGLDHAEGICLAPDGNLYVGGEAGQLYRIGPDGSPVELLRTGGFALGLAADADSNIFMCDPKSGCVWRIDPASATATIFAEGGITNPNWGCFDSTGRYYFSDSGSWHGSNGLIWVVEPNGTLSEWTRESCEFPNGMALSADESTLYVLESTSSALVAIAINADGSAGSRTVVAQMPGAVPDGVALTTDGRFVVACYRPDVVYLIDSDGAVEVLAEDPEGTVLSAPTNVVFRGPSLDEIVVPNLGRWHLARFSHEGIAGIPLNYPTLTATRPSRSRDERDLA